MTNEQTISGNFSGASQLDAFPYIYVKWEQDIANNKTTVTVSAQFHRRNTNYYSSNLFEDSRGHSSKLTVSSPQLSSDYVRSGTRPFNIGWTSPPNDSNPAIWGQDSITIDHNASGNASFTVKFEGNTNGTNLGTYNFNGTITLPQIPRETTINSVSMRNTLRPGTNNILDISLDRKYSGYSHEFEIVSAGTVLYSSTGNVPSTLTIPGADITKMVATMETSRTKNFTFRVRTKSNNTTIGAAQTMNFSTEVNDTYTSPTISNDSITILGSGRDSQIGKYVQGITRIRVQFRANFGTGAKYRNMTVRVNGSLVSGTLLSDGITYRAETSVLTMSGSVDVDIRATNTRRQTTPKVVPITVHAYSAPSITRFTGIRQSNDTTIQISRRHTRTSLDGDNTPTAYIERQASNSTTWERVDTSNALARDVPIHNNSATLSYRYRTRVTDRFGNWDEAEFTIGTAEVLMEKYKDRGISIGQRFDRSAGSARLQVGGDVSIEGGLTIRSQNYDFPYIREAIMLNGFDHHAWSNNKVRYYKIAGIVYITGSIQHNHTPSMGDVIFKLPEGYRPRSAIIFYVHQGNRRLDVQSNGNVIWNNTDAIEGTGWRALGSISFPAWN